MVIVLTGPTGVGKTDTAWALLPLFRELVFLDADWFASRIPFSWANESDVQAVYLQLGLNISFQADQGKTFFVITIPFEMAVCYHKYAFHLSQKNFPLHGFRLRCSLAVLEKRIIGRDRVAWQKQQELEIMQTQQQNFDRLFPDDIVFKRIDTSCLTEEQVAQIIFDKL